MNRDDGRANRRPPPIHSSGEKGGAEYIRENVRKLGLWNTRSFKPIVTQDELELGMSMLGFSVGATTEGPGGTWREYVYAGALTWMPRPRLPFPRIDGLHMQTYAAFLDAVNFHVRIDNVADIFHVREMKLHRIYDRNERWKRMEDDEYSVFVYRFGTIEQPVQSFFLRNCQNYILDAYSNDDIMLIRKHETSKLISRLVPLKDIIVSPKKDKLDS